MIIKIQTNDAIDFINRWVKRVGRLNRESDNFEVRLAWGGAYGEGELDVEDIYKHADTEMYINEITLKKQLEVKY